MRMAANPDPECLMSITRWRGAALRRILNGIRSGDRQRANSSPSSARPAAENRLCCG